MKTKICKKCLKLMKIKHKENVLIPQQHLDWDSMTDGQQAEYYAEEMSGEPCNFGVLQVTYECPSCKKREMIEYI